MIVSNNKIKKVERSKIRHMLATICILYSSCFCGGGLDAINSARITIDAASALTERAKILYKFNVA
jgi:hypothetical protein